jgi:hypothetical protein
MQQRNATDHPLDVPAIPATVQPGDTVDWPVPIAGFEPVPSPAKTRTSKSIPAQSGDEGTDR